MSQGTEGDQCNRTHLDVSESLLGSSRVGEGNLEHLEDGLFPAGDSIQGGRLGEFEPQGRCCKLIVGLRLWLLLHKLAEIPLVLLEPPVLVVVDIGAHLVKEARVMGHCHASETWLGHEVVLQPGNVGVIEMVCRL